MTEAKGLQPGQFLETQAERTQRVMTDIQHLKARQRQQHFLAVRTHADPVGHQSQRTQFAKV
ncbi:hypothetical protein D3C76_749080 [compost metagenome]